MPCSRSTWATYSSLSIASATARRSATLSGEEPPSDGSPDDADWLVLLDDHGDRVLTIQEKKDTTPPTWPSEEVPMQMHMDFRVPSVEDLERHRERAETLGARLLHDRSKDEGEPLYVLADPAGHPFCLLVQ